MANKITCRTLPILFSLFLLISCGGSGGGSSSSGTDGGGLSLSQGVAVDPYIVGAVFREVASNGTVLQRQSSPSDQSGVFTFPEPLTAGSTVELKISNKGLHDGAPYEGMLRRSVGAGDTEPLVVSPMTTVLANGATAGDLLQALSETGIAGLTTADLYADPMAGLEDMTSGVTDQALAPLQAAMAIDAYMEVTNNFTAGANELTDSTQFEIFRNMVQAQLQMLSSEEFTRVSSALANDSSITSPITLGDMIRTAVQQQRTLIEQVRNNLQTTGSFDPTIVDQTVQNNLDQSVTMTKANYMLRVPPVNAPDGATLYADNCAVCHGAIDVSTKAGKTAADIQAAIDNNTGGMGAFSNLTSAEIQAIADALTAAGSTSPPATVDGATLYSANCSSCHGALDVTTKPGRTAADIQNAIDTIGAMASLSSLTADEIQAIADALPAASTPPGSTGPLDGATLYATNCASCHGALDVTTKAGRTAADIQNAIDTVGVMASLSSLTADEIQAIADVLPAASAGTPDYSDCTACHGQPPSGDTFPNTAGAHAVHVVLPSINNDCAVCHSGASHNSQVEVVIQASFDAKSGTAVYNGDGTCSNVSCHGGKTSPVWWTGTIALDTQCSSCHASGTSQYNSYYSGR
ncbi:MAG: CxxxxCH/CxxCH domain-containing protein, partial [Deltaproteobacteria bacterium]